MFETLLTVEELAAWIGISSKAIYDLRYRGDPGTLPPSIDVGGSLRFDPDDVREWLHEKKEQPRRRRGDRVADRWGTDIEKRKRTDAGKLPVRVSPSLPKKETHE